MNNSLLLYKIVLLLCKTIYLINIFRWLFIISKFYESISVFFVCIAVRNAFKRGKSREKKIQSRMGCCMFLTNYLKCFVLFSIALRSLIYVSEKRFYCILWVFGWITKKMLSESVYGQFLAITQTSWHSLFVQTV